MDSHNVLLLQFTLKNKKKGQICPFFHLSHNLRIIRVKAKKIKTLNKALAALTGLPLQQWLNKASIICPELQQALEGMYCGKEGKIHEELQGDYKGIFVTMGWYTVVQPKVEYAYCS